MNPPICTTPSSWLSPWNTLKIYTYSAQELLSVRLQAGIAQPPAQRQAQRSRQLSTIVTGTPDRYHPPKMDQESPLKAVGTVLKAQLFESQALITLLWFQLINFNVVLPSFFFLNWKKIVSLIITTYIDLQSNTAIMLNLKLFSKQASDYVCIGLKCIYAHTFI